MKYALLNNKRIEPQKGIKDAVCPVCGEIMIPCCGDIKMHYWRHKSKLNCDPWWENETEWHRQWKDNFPKECQEIIMHDEKTGEKHVADVKTKTGIVLEFQHLPMSIKEQYSREHFYKNMIWVVDAQEKYRELEINVHVLKLYKKNYFYGTDIYDIFPNNWLDSKVPVIFDYGINVLWCIFPEGIDDNRIGLCIEKEEFIEKVTKYSSFYNKKILLQLKTQLLKEKEEFNKKLKKEWMEHNYLIYEEEVRKQQIKKEQEQKEHIYEQNYINFKNNLENKNILPLYLKIIQKNSEELKLNPNLKIGDIYSNITNRTYNNADITICGYKVNYLEYDNVKRGKLLNTYEEWNEVVKTAKVIKRDYNGYSCSELRTTKGSILNKRYEFLIIVQSETDIRPAIISLSNKKGEEIANDFYKNADKYKLFKLNTYSENDYYKFHLVENFTIKIGDSDIIKAIEQLKILSGKILYQKH